MVYAPLTEAQFREIFFESVHYSEEYMLAAYDGQGGLAGFTAGLVKRKYLQGETFFNTPGYVTMVLVSPAWRRMGVGTKLLEELERRFHAIGKSRVMVTYRNPMALTWQILEGGGARHNNAPGVVLDSPAYRLFVKKGYETKAVEDGMYLPLHHFTVGEKALQKQKRLMKDGIVVELYDREKHEGFEELFDALHGEVWRETIRDNERRKKPLPVLIAAEGRKIIGFAGPVDKEKNGRGWFNGIATHPEYERRGIATVLFHRLMEQFSLIGAEYSTLFTDEGNPALTLYESVGFKVAGRFAVMEKEL